MGGKNGIGGKGMEWKERKGGKSLDFFYI